jgi:hypothetical protein
MHVAAARALHRVDHGGKLSEVVRRFGNAAALEEGGRSDDQPAACRDFARED